MISKWWIFHVSMLVDWGNMHQPDKKICPQALKVFLFTLLMICWSATCQSEQILKQRILPSVKHGLLENPPLKNLVS
jgi:hypothetical protein